MYIHRLKPFLFIHLFPFARRQFQDEVEHDLPFEKAKPSTFYQIFEDF